jgi:hypothetical protein
LWHRWGWFLKNWRGQRQSGNLTDTADQTEIKIGFSATFLAVANPGVTSVAGDVLVVDRACCSFWWQ